MRDTLKQTISLEALEAYEKVCKVIRSCETLSQLKVAAKMCSAYNKKYGEFKWWQSMLKIQRRTIANDILKGVNE